MTNAISELDAARQAVDEKNWVTARRLLAPLVANNPYGIAGFLLARTELELGHPEVAGPLVAAFRAQRPRHVGSAVLAARIHLAAGELDEAEKLARTVLEIEPDNRVAPRLLERIGAAGATADLAGQIAVVDARHLEAREGEPSPELRAAAQALRDTEPGPDWVRDSEQAKIAFLHHARDLDAALRSYDPHLIEIAARFDYLSWPKRIQEHLGASVLDVGCGPGGLGIGYLVAGASSYTGIDPAIELDSTRARDKRTRRWDDMGVTPRQISEDLPGVRVVQDRVEAHHFEETFDTIVLHNVSEHLPNLGEVLSSLTRWCHRETRLVLLHHNFYSWSGHKRQPHRAGAFDERNPEHRRLVDWQHVSSGPDLPADHELLANLNRVRLSELRRTLERDFVIDRWEEVRSDAATCARLTPAVLDRVRQTVPDIAERDLLVNSLFCVAGPRN